MKWFKHISDSLDDPFIFDLIVEFGGDGYLVFFGILEILARECDGDFTKFQPFSDKFLAKKLQLSVRKLSKILCFIEKKGRFLIKFDKREIAINCPKLQDLQDDYTRKKRAKSPDTSRRNYPLEVEEDKDIPPIVPQGDGEGGRNWDEFCQHFGLGELKRSAELTDKVLAHLLATSREAGVRDPLAVAKARKGEPDKMDLRSVRAWLYPPPRGPSGEQVCECGSELHGDVAQGSGLRSLICYECRKVYPGR